MPALGRAGIAFRAIKILPLNSRPEVLLLRALLRSLLHPADRESWAAILRAPCCGLNTIDLHVLMAGDNRPIWQLIADNEVTQRLSADAQTRLTFIRQALVPCLENSGKVPVRDLLETAWVRLSMPAIVDEGSSSNINAALELIESLEEGGRINFALLDERLEQLYAAPDASAQAGQVELLTMHGAKGLQWDVVILPGLGHSGGKTDSPLLAFTEVPVPGGATPLIAAKAETRNKDALYSLVCSVEKNKYNNELQRLLYVACTRAKTTLHMLGHVSENKEEASRGSLLSLLLAGSEDCFGAQITSSDPMEQHENDERNLLQRISRMPEITESKDEGGSDQETEYVWAGAEAAPVGNAVHAALQRVAEAGIENWDAENTNRVLAQMQRMLMADGLSGDMLETATSRCADGLQRVLNSEKGRWMLSGEHQDAYSEWALSSEYENRVSHHVIDRSFVDEQGIRWIIDYKTASHEGGDLDRFLADEEARHAPQLQRYAAILKGLEPGREIRTALYFPMLDAWKEVVDADVSLRLD
jgi:ATP-dependent exoDNAse (exonuclease V) beta subunit